LISSLCLRVPVVGVFAKVDERFIFFKMCCAAAKGVTDKKKNKQPQKQQLNLQAYNGIKKT